MLPLRPGRSVYSLGPPITTSDLLETSPYDQIVVDGRELDIKALRQIIGQFQQSPSGPVRVFVINYADKLSELMQNTLLKIIEEPPPKGAIVLQVASVDSLLPTVRSRLAPLSLTAKRRGNRPVGGLNEIASLNRQQALDYLEQSIAAVDLASDRGLTEHRLLSQAVIRLKQNLNFKLVIDELLLNWGQEFGKE